MLLRLTNRCHNGCTHCVIDASGPDGEHMLSSTLLDALAFMYELGSHVLVIGGGEPTDHPDLHLMMELIGRVKRDLYPMFVVFATNGTWALDPARRAEVERSLGGVVDGIQVTHDPRFYPANGVALARHLFPPPLYTFCDRIGSEIIGCRRTRENGIEAGRKYPTCGNLVINTPVYGLEEAVQRLEMAGRSCCPSVDVDGTIRLGEMDWCESLGNVADSGEDDLVLGAIEDAITASRCDRCGLWSNVSPGLRARAGRDEP